jgi:hypothetical protein
LRRSLQKAVSDVASRLAVEAESRAGGNRASALRGER